MVKKAEFEDPLNDVDPIMEQAYTINSSEVGSDFDSNQGGVNTDESDDIFDYNDSDLSLDSNLEHEVSQSLEEVGKDIKEPNIVSDNQDKEEAGDRFSSVSEVQFPSLSSKTKGRSIKSDIFSNIPITVAVELGRSRVSLKEVFELTEGSIIELERLVGEPLDLVVNGQIVAKGEVVAIDNNYGLRVTTIVSALTP